MDERQSDFHVPGESKKYTFNEPQNVTITSIFKILTWIRQ